MASGAGRVAPTADTSRRIHQRSASNQHTSRHGHASTTRRGYRATAASATAWVIFVGGQSYRLRGNRKEITHQPTNPLDRAVFNRPQPRNFRPALTARQPGWETALVAVAPPWWMVKVNGTGILGLRLWLVLVVEVLG